MARPQAVAGSTSPPSARWTDPTGVRTFIRVNLAALLAAAAMVGAVRVWLVSTNWLDVLLVAFVAVALCLARAEVLVNADRPVAAVVLVAATNWAIAVAATAIAPSAFNVLPLILLLPPLLAVRYLNRPELAALNGATIIVMAAVATLGRLSPGVGIEEMAPDWVLNAVAVLFVPIGAGMACFLAWTDHTAMTAKALELEKSRSRLLAAADAQRHRIASSLRVGPQRHVADVFAQIQQIRTGRPAHTTHLLDALTQHLEDANAELRELTHGIYPSHLSEHGIEHALRTALRLCSVPTAVNTTGLTRYPPEVEATVYFCCLWAIEDADAHGATSAVIDLRDDGELSFQAPAPRPADLAANGPSLYTDMSDRVYAVGGRVRLHINGDGSLRLHGHFPRTALHPDSTVDTHGLSAAGYSRLAGLWYLFARLWNRAGRNDGTEPSVATGIKALVAAAAGSLPLIAAVSVVVPDVWLLVLAASAALVWLLLRSILRSTHRLRDQTAVIAAATIFCSYVLVVTLLIPITASCAPMMMVIPVIMAVPYLPRRSFQLSMAATIAAATVAVVAGGLPGVGLQEQAPDWFADLAIIELAVLNSTLALFFAWENQIGISAQTRRLHESRRRIVAATERERQRIERDLHDGAQQRLVAAAIEARVAQRLLTSQPHRADEMLGALSEHVAEALTELRDLAHGIYPPHLAHGGLAEALDAATKRAPTPATVYATDLGRHPPHIELSVYFCCLEALQNAAKHAGETARVSISLTDHDGGLTFDVRDTGPGCDPATLYTGHGITNMHDRLTAIGGTLTVDSTPGAGVHIHGHVPATTENGDPRANRVPGLTATPSGPRH